ncbi:MAG: carboxylesterase family protein [Methanotrichaceae archaeon]|nr:carboxylesterase family protein [Methanotrichaceae archaeon]
MKAGRLPTAEPRPLSITDSVDRPETGFSWIIFIHDGGWMSGDSHRTGPFVDFPSVLASFGIMDHVVVSIEYRLSGR